MTTIESPRTAPPKRRFNIEKWGWIYMRASGVILVVLIFGHLFVNLFQGTGVRAIDWGFVAGKWANPFWIVWDTLLLWLALIHGANGMRTVVNDYAKKPWLRKTFLLAILVSTIVLLTLGTLVIYTFDACLDPAVASDLGKVCTQ
jgi:succinate dehydrogenase / fumarate reductase membrane anchor subunit